MQHFAQNYEELWHIIFSYVIEEKRQLIPLLITSQHMYSFVTACDDYLFYGMARHSITEMNDPLPRLPSVLFLRSTKGLHLLKKLDSHVLELDRLLIYANSCTMELMEVLKHVIWDISLLESVKTPELTDLYTAVNSVVAALMEISKGETVDWTTLSIQLRCCLDYSRVTVTRACRKELFRDICASTVISRVQDYPKELYILASHYPGVIRKITSKDLITDRSFAISLVKANPSVLSYLCADMIHRDVVMEAVKIDGNILMYAGPFVDDKDVVMAAIHQNPLAIHHASANLKSDYSIVYKAIRKRPDLLEQHTFIGWANDRQFMSELVKVNTAVLFHASSAIRGDKAIVLEAVKRSGVTINAVPDEVCDETIIGAAVETYPAALQKASESLRDNIHLVTKAVRKNGYVLRYASPRLRDNKGIVLMAVSHYNSYCIQYASERLRNDPEVVLAAIQYDHSALKYASKRLQNNSKLVLAAYKMHPQSLCYASDKLKRDIPYMVAYKDSDWCLLQ